MEQDETIKKHIHFPVGISYWRGSRSSWEYLRHILLKLIGSYYEKKKFDHHLFHTMYHDLEHFFYRNEIPIVMRAPLQNFDSKIGSVSVDKGLTLRRITDEEKEYFLNNLENMHLTSSEVLQIEYILDYRFIEKKIFGDIDNPSSSSRLDNIEKLITTMRLFKSGDVGCSIMTERCMLDIPILAGEHRYSQLSNFPEGRKFILKVDEVNKFRRFWRTIDNIHLSNSSPLKLSLRRFDYAYQKTLGEDKLLDYVISFEALLGKEQESKDSLTYKFSLRFSLYVEKVTLKEKTILIRCRIYIHLEVPSFTEYGNQIFMKKEILLLLRLENYNQLDLLLHNKLQFINRID